ncbi:MAG: hypothetical protein M1827_003091 [Pycnora praestabilis]|nr:MAG: hypothetical protein M1827_003091 [Pycnora praestabilis]
MAALRSTVVRHALGEGAPFLRGSQRRWAQVHDVRFLATHKEPNRVTEKYKEKLDKKAKEEGLRDVNELKEAYKDKIHSLRTNASVPGATAPRVSTSPFPTPPPPPRQPDQPIDDSAFTTPLSSAGIKSSDPPGVKTLSSFIDVEKTLELPQKEIEYIWRLRHAQDKNSLCAVIPRAIYERVEDTAKRHPQFILPLPREGQGAEIHFLQWTFPTPTTTTVLFTHLAEFKLRGEYSQPHTTVTHHLDLAAPKGLVLLQGSVVEGRGITVDEGKWLLMCLQKFYGTGEEQTPRKKLLEQFSQGDGGFKVEELLEEAEKIS